MRDEKPRRKTSIFTILLLVLISLVLVVLLQTTFILFIVGMLPSFVAYYVDVTQNRHTFRSVCACNLAGVIPFIAELIAKGNSTTDMQMMMDNIYVWFFMYASAGFGWVLTWGGPLFANVLITLFNQKQVLHLESVQQRLVEEWGAELKNRSLDV